jgi:hypothetical protein
MMRPRTIKVVALVLSAIAALTALLGYDLVYQRRVTDDPAPQTDRFKADLKSWHRLFPAWALCCMIGLGP